MSPSTFDFFSKCHTSVFLYVLDPHFLVVFREKGYAERGQAQRFPKEIKGFSCFQSIFKSASVFLRSHSMGTGFSFRARASRRMALAVAILSIFILVFRTGLKT